VYRDDLEAAQQRAEALEREMRELRADDEKDKARIEELEGELKTARKAIDDARKGVTGDKEETRSSSKWWIGGIALLAAALGAVCSLRSTKPSVQAPAGYSRSKTCLSAYARYQGSSPTLDTLDAVCDCGHGPACNSYGYNYDLGQGVPEDDAKAVRYYRRACERSEYHGCANLGWMIENGSGAPKDPSAAAPLYRKACDLGNQRGCAFHGWAYANGSGVDEDVPRATAIYERTCAAGEAVACSYLGELHDAADKDYARAAELYRKACDGGEMRGCTFLGALHEEGHGVGADGGRAKGKGVPKDPARAASILARACALGHRAACRP